MAIKGIDLNNNLQFSQNEKTHISELIKRILTTRRGERIGDLSFGSDLLNYIFLPEIATSDIANEIKNSIERSDSRFTVEEVEIGTFEDETLKINLTVKINDSDEEFQTSLTIQGE